MPRLYVPAADGPDDGEVENHRSGCQDSLGRWGLLNLAGVLSALIAALHVVIIIVGGPAYRYFGAGEPMARLADQGSLVPGLVTTGLTAIFAAWSAYAFSGAGRLRRLPLLRTALVAIGIFYTLRGVLLGPQAVWFFEGFRHEVPPRQLAFSAVALVTGLAYLIGTKQRWDRLRPGI